MMRKLVVQCALLLTAAGGLLAAAPMQAATPDAVASAPEADAAPAPALEALPSFVGPGPIHFDLPPVDGLLVGPVALQTIQSHLAAGDERRALAVAQAYVEENAWGRDRDAAWLVIGLIHRDAGRHNLASEAFTKVRSSKGPLGQLAAFYEAEQDLARGRQWVAIKECDAYRKAWPKGPHAGACQRLVAMAHADLGNTATARSLASEYDDENDNATISEQVELRMALALAEALGALAHDPLVDEATTPSVRRGSVAEVLACDLVVKLVAHGTYDSLTVDLDLT